MYRESSEENKNRTNKKAIALGYQPLNDSAPKVLASGKGYLAQKIIAMAEEHQIPVQEDPTLAKMLEKLEVGSEIPAELYQVVAEVLAFVYGLDKKVQLSRSAGHKRTKDYTAT